MIKKRRTELVEYAMPPKVKGPVDMVRSDIELLIKNKLDDDYVWTYTRETLTKRMNNVLKIAVVGFANHAIQRCWIAALC